MPPINRFVPKWLIRQRTLGGYDSGDLCLTAAEIAEIVRPLTRPAQADTLGLFRRMAVFNDNTGHRHPMRPWPLFGRSC
jgi:hypothetical protein